MAAITEKKIVTDYHTKEIRECHATPTMLKTHSQKIAIPSSYFPSKTPLKREVQIKENPRHREIATEKNIDFSTSIVEDCRSIVDQMKVKSQPTDSQETVHNTIKVDVNLTSDENKEINEFVTWAFSDSEIFLQLHNMRVSHIDVLILFCEYLKIDILNQEQEKISRRLEKAAYIDELIEVMKNFKSQGQALLFACVGGGVLGLISGASPMVGHLWGKDLQKLISTIPLFRSLAGMKTTEFTKSLTEITRVMSDVYKSTGQIHNSYATGDERKHSGYGELHREEANKSLSDIQNAMQSWRSMENFMSQVLQWQHDAAKSTYGG